MGSVGDALGPLDDAFASNTGGGAPTAGGSGGSNNFLMQMFGAQILADYYKKGGIPVGEEEYSAGAAIFREAINAMALPMIAAQWMRSGLTIPGVNVQIPGPLQARSFGQQTGAGTLAGYTSMLHGLSLGASPFGMISPEMGAQIQAATAQQGFSGTMQNDVANASASLIKGMGIDYTQAVQLVTNNVKNGTLSLKDFVTAMENLKSVAKDTGQSLGMVTAAVSNYTTAVTTAGGKGAEPAAIASSTALLKAFPQAGKAGTMENWAANIATVPVQMALAAMGHGNALNWMNEQTTAIPKGYQNVLNEFASRKPAGMTMPAYAALLLEEGIPFFQGLTNTQLTNQLSKGNLGTGFLKKYEAGLKKITKLPPPATKPPSGFGWGRLVGGVTSALHFTEGLIPAVMNANANPTAFNQAVKEGVLQQNLNQMRDSLKSAFNTTQPVLTNPLVRAIAALPKPGTPGFQKAYSQLQPRIEAAYKLASKELAAGGLSSNTVAREAIAVTSHVEIGLTADAKKHLTAKVVTTTAKQTAEKEKGRARTYGAVPVKTVKSP